MWWRDDDAVAPTDTLARLLDAAAAVGVAPVLAIIPADLDDGLPAWLARWPGVRAAPHGWSHANHAPPTDKKAELGAHRPLETVLADVAKGWARVSAAFGGQALPLAVPPWNRFHPDLPHRLPEVRLAALSAYGGRPFGASAARVDTHVDLIAWKAGRGFVGEAAAVDAAVAALEAARTGGKTEPIGILTHHLVEVEAAAAFLTSLVPRIEWAGGVFLDGDGVLAAAAAMRGAA